MGGGEGKVPVLTATLMASIWGFLGEKHLRVFQLKLLSTFWCWPDIITKVFGLFSPSALKTHIAIGLYIVLRGAGWAGSTDQRSNHREKRAKCCESCSRTTQPFVCGSFVPQQHGRIDNLQIYLNHIFPFMYSFK